MPEKKILIPAKKYKGDTSVVSARLPVQMIKDIDMIAEKTGRNRNEIIPLCLEYAIENIEISEDEKRVL